MANSRRHQAAAASHYHMQLNDTSVNLADQLNRLAEIPQTSVNELAQNITAAIVGQQNIVLAAILIKPKDLKQLILAGYQSTKPLQIYRPLHIHDQYDWLHASEDSHIFQIGQIDVNQIAEYLSWSSAQTEYNLSILKLKTVYMVKLKAHGHLTGLLVIGFSKLIDRPESSLLKSINSVKGLVAGLTYGLISEQESSHYLRRLKLFDKKLEELDETRDEFISMASHQLRTPLTSVKGYVSMILEGDAGAINHEQRTMLNQAFASCQRMVYLISDLLNVSRIKTGKFVINRSPVNLDEVARDEIAQINEIAKSRSIKIDYLPPRSIHNLNLDETKIRQVIMNFIDNALYYTPADGRIIVSLVDRPSAIELRIKDNGIGVPKSERHYLFTKFYRATNARKARPDGTGLGLFMAKKIIIAQGGAVIFDSVEGRGSTFGFMFPKTEELLSPVD